MALNKKILNEIENYLVDHFNFIRPYAKELVEGLDLKDDEIVDRELIKTEKKIK